MNTDTDNTVTETTTLTVEAPAKAPKAKVLYPFPTKREILLSQELDEVVLEHLGILYQRQTEDEKETKTTRYRNRRGFMSSHSVVGTALVEKVASGQALSFEEMAKARGIVCRYGKQLAAHYRDEMLEANPELARVAEIFSAG